MILSICNNSTTLSVMRFVRIAITVIKIAVPIILIVSLMLSYVSALKDGDNHALREANGGAVKKVIAAILVFFIPTFFNLIADAANYKTDSVMACYQNASSSNIAKAKANEANLYIEKASKSLKRSDYNVAVSKVNSVEDESLKESLKGELKTVMASIEAKEEKERQEKKSIIEAIEAAVKARRWKGAKFYWPIGSSDTTEKDGVLFADGAPVSKSITATFAGNDKVHQGLGGGHGAIDIGAATGTYVIAAEDGTVTYPGAGDRIDYPDQSIKPDSNGKYNCSGLKANYVTIDHGNGYVTSYKHLYKNTIVVRAGDQVKKGQVIGRVGSSGCSTGPHLHFEVIYNGQRVDPLEYVNPNAPR